jgi:hypothetical protein
MESWKSKLSDFCAISNFLANLNILMAFMRPLKRILFSKEQTFGLIILKVII